MSYKEIEKFNQELIDSKIFVNLERYFVFIRKTLDFDLNYTFLDLFLEYYEKDGFNINQELLFKCGVTKKKKSTIRRLVNETYNFIENKDYIMKKENVKDTIGRIKPTNVYYFTWDAFETCLLRSHNESKYSRYYLYFKKVLKSYNKYLLMKKDVEIEQINNEIKQKENEKYKLNNEIKELKNDIEYLKNLITKRY